MGSVFRVCATGHAIPFVEGNGKPRLLPLPKVTLALTAVSCCGNYVGILTRDNWIKVFVWQEVHDPDTKTKEWCYQEISMSFGLLDRPQNLTWNEEKRPPQLLIRQPCGQRTVTSYDGGNTWVLEP